MNIAASTTSFERRHARAPVCARCRQALTALAASKGWHSLVAPGILVGMFGYAIATFIGVAITTVLN